MTVVTSHAETATEESIPRDHHTCPVWVGRLLASPLRRIVENPLKIFSPYLSAGDIAVDVGSAMGFHSLDLARLVGPDGRVICLDIQQEMLDGLVKRARRTKLDGVIEPRLCTQQDLGLADLKGWVDLVVAFNVVHETSYPKRFLASCVEALEPGGHLFIAEPKGHVTDEDFETTVRAAEELGLTRRPAPGVFKSHTALFAR